MCICIGIYSTIRYLERLKNYSADYHCYKPKYTFLHSMTPLKSVLALNYDIAFCICTFIGAYNLLWVALNSKFLSNKYISSIYTHIYKYSEISLYIYY